MPRIALEVRNQKLGHLRYRPKDRLDAQDEELLAYRIWALITIGPSHPRLQTIPLTMPAFVDTGAFFSIFPQQVWDEPAFLDRVRPWEHSDAVTRAVPIGGQKGIFYDLCKIDVGVLSRDGETWLPAVPVTAKLLHGNPAVLNDGPIIGLAGSVLDNRKLCRVSTNTLPHRQRWYLEGS